MLLGAETGSGKTLTYLLPALDWLLSRPVAESARKYPRVVVLQPNRELCAQLEGVIASLIGPSGQRDLPVTHPGMGEGGGGSTTTRLHFASLVGTQLFPPPGMPVCDILVCTPSCLQHNLPPVELARLRARAIKQARANAELAAISAGTHATGVSSDPSAPVLLTPTSSPGFNPRGFDPLAFVAAQRIVVLDEVDFLLEGGDGHRVRQLLEQTWIKFEPPAGLERASTQGRRNRWRREGRSEDPRERSTSMFDAHADADAEAEMEATLAAQRAPPPHGRARQFVFVGATLANISPLTSVQYLLNTFTPRWSQPPLAQSGPVSLHPEDVARGCHLKLRLSSGFHHLSPGLGRRGTVQWERVGPAHRGPAPGEWDPATGIDEARLAAVDRAHDSASGSGLGSSLSPQELEEEDARFAAAEAMSLRARGAQKVLKKSAGKKGKNSFGALRPEAHAQPGQTAAAAGAPPTRFEEETDLEKVEATVRFLNAHTPAPITGTGGQAGTLQPPRKSLLFVEKNTRLATLEAHLRSLQTAHRGHHGGDAALGLSAHVQIIPYHAGLKAEERALAMALFNSRAPGGMHVPGSGASVGAVAALTDPSGAGAGSKKKDAVPVTHQVLLCTSLAARGLDFNQIAPPAPTGARTAAPTATGAKQTKSKRGGVAVATAAEQIPGFESLVQFDLATNVVDYIHRCGRMFRHRPAVPAPAPASVAQGVDAAGVHGAGAAAESAASEPTAPTSSTAASAAATAEPELAKVLNLYTAQDELLVSHLRDSKGAVTSTGEADAGGDGPAPGSTLISDAAFSRKRRLRNKARKAERAAAEAAEAEAEAQATQQ